VQPVSAATTALNMEIGICYFVAVKDLEKLSNEPYRTIHSLLSKIRANVIDRLTGKKGVFRVTHEQSHI
jgi:hypothetical protein